jgi:hemerythrin-like metal-binding protein
LCSPREFIVSDTYVWKKQFAVGFEQIDREHEETFTLVNSVLAAIERRADALMVRDLLRALQQHSASHVAHEEALLREYGYPHIVMVEREHAHLAREFADLVITVPDMRAGPALVSDILRGWLLEHILGTDKRALIWAARHSKCSDRPVSERSAA